MGNSWISMKDNGANREQIACAYRSLKTHKVLDVSDMEYFGIHKPVAADVEDIEIGEDIDETLVRFQDHKFIAFKGKLKITDELLKCGD